MPAPTRTTPVAPFGAIAIYRLVQTVAAAGQALRARIVARRTRRILAGLSDEILEDIGLSRADIV